LSLKYRGVSAAKKYSKICFRLSISDLLVRRDGRSRFSPHLCGENGSFSESKKEDGMQVNPYLEFNGQCEEAFRFYERCFNGKIEMMLTHGESPMADKVPVEWHKAVMHARLNIGDRVVLGSDRPPQQYKAPQGISVFLGIDDPAEAERVFRALEENGKVGMPLQETFWALRFGMVVDQYGIPWLINCEKHA
jgi:PhnB protein